MKEQSLQKFHEERDDQADMFADRLADLLLNEHRLNTALLKLNAAGLGDKSRAEARVCKALHQRRQTAISLMYVFEDLAGITHTVITEHNEPR